MHLWRFPSLSIHGIEGAFDEPGAKTVIPGRVTGKFSIRLVPHMDASLVETQVTRAARGRPEAPHSSGSSSRAGSEARLCFSQNERGENRCPNTTHIICVQ